MRPLEGIKVVDAATYIVGPFSTLQFADLGATVVKVEPPKGGDPFRRFGRLHNGMNPMFANCNRNKRSVFLDLKSETGARELSELLADSDVLVTNWRPSVAERIGFTAEEVRERFPRLVWIRASGFGQAGPFAERPTFDSIVQARTGYASRVDDDPALGHGYIADKVTALVATQAALAALVSRASTGTGSIVDVAMLDAMAYFNSPDLFGAHTVVGEEDAEILRHIEVLRPLRTRDGWIVLNAASGRQLSATARAVGHPEWIEELKAIPSPAGLVAGLADRLEPIFATKTTSECEALLTAADVPAGEVLDLARHLDDEPVVFNEVYRVVEDPTLGLVRRVRHPARFDGTPVDTDDLDVPPLPLPESTA